MMERERGGFKTMTSGMRSLAALALLLARTGPAIAAAVTAPPARVWYLKPSIPTGDQANAGRSKHWLAPSPSEIQRVAALTLGSPAIPAVLFACSPRQATVRAVGSPVPPTPCPPGCSSCGPPAEPAIRRSGR